ncbi:hypothetical protein FHV99_004590 [Ochrobactrum sp. P20RRXII]|nr:YfbR-like 5'-deoxynucleotidase [Ochrobactrum sp. P20RRXII]NIH77338.1 hypothetical protein [Ochrobactrum sp. P20RRXII]
MTRIGNAMHTAAGGIYYPFDPRVEEVDIYTIAHHLATRGRFNGATQHKKHPSRIFYSVAEHSVYVAWYVEHILKRPDLALTALLHDAAEAYNGDLIRPLKYSPEFSAPFKAVEEINEAVIAKAFNTPFPMPHEVKLADEAVGRAELQQIVPNPIDRGPNHFEGDAVANIEIEMYEPIYARNMFLMEFNRLVPAEQQVEW